MLWKHQFFLNICKNIHTHQIRIHMPLVTPYLTLDTSPPARWGSLDFIRVTCSPLFFSFLLPDPNCQLQISVGTAGTQLRGRKAVKWPWTRSSISRELWSLWNKCQTECQKKCQIGCQSICQKEYQNTCQISLESQIECQIKCQKKYQIGCQNRMSEQIAR